MTAALSSEELEAMLVGSGLTASDFAREMRMQPSNFRKLRAELRVGETINANIADAIRYRFGSRDARLIGIARVALAAVVELEAAYGRDARPPHAPDPRAPWHRARSLIDKAKAAGLLDTPPYSDNPPL